MSLEHFNIIDNANVDLNFAEEKGFNISKLNTCVQCGTCSSSCPTYFAMDVSPRKLWRMLALGLKEEIGQTDTFWLCTSCNSCTVRCPRGIPVADTMREMRELILGEGMQPTPEALNRLRNLITESHNMMGDDNETRLIWSDNLPEGLGEIKRQADVVWFVGCVSSFYPMAYKIPQSLVQVLNKSGIDFTLMGGREWCCGFPLFTAGMSDSVNELAINNLDQVVATGAKTLITTCASCYHTWKHIYPEILSRFPKDLEILHASEYLARLVAQRKFKLGPVERIITYHDPCDLGKRNGIFDEPRYVLENIPGIEMREMVNHHQNSLCCGGGGNVEAFSPDTVEIASKNRLLQAQQTGASYIVSACQQCMRTFTGGARKNKIRIRAIDLTQLVYESIENSSF